MRKVIQIAANSEGDTTDALVFALCDDGTMWGRQIVMDGVWVQLPPIPQPAAKEGE